MKALLPRGAQVALAAATMQKAKRTGMSILLLIGLSLTVSACQQPLPASVEHTVQSDLLAAQDNLSQAVAAGTLSDTDPAYLCIKAVNSNLAVGQTSTGTPAPAWQNKGLVSVGSILYIQAQQLKKFASQAQNSSCQQLIGMIVIDAARLSNANLGIISPVKLP